MTAFYKVIIGLQVAGGLFLVALTLSSGEYMAAGVSVLLVIAAIAAVWERMHDA